MGKDRSDDYKYYVGLEFGFELNIEKTYESGYSTCDIASIVWSVSDETRWTKENVFEYLKNELTWSVNEVEE